MANLYTGDEGGEAIGRWHERLGPYLDGQGDGVKALRGRSETQPPWPARDNPILGYLIDRAAEIAETDDWRHAIVWLAVHAWFEGSLDTRAAVIRGITA
jgi:hypothetical protein